MQIWPSLVRFPFPATPPPRTPPHHPPPPSPPPSPRFPRPDASSPSLSFASYRTHNLAHIYTYAHPVSAHPSQPDLWFSALHLSVMANQPSLIQWLLEHKSGCNPCARDG